MGSELGLFYIPRKDMSLLGPTVVNIQQAYEWNKSEKSSYALLLRATAHQLPWQRLGL